MKKFLIVVLVIAMVSMMGLVAFAIEKNYPETIKDWNVKATIQEDGSVKITYDPKAGDADWFSQVDNVQIAIYTSEPDFSEKQMTDKGGTYGDMIADGGTTHPTERVLTVGTGDNAYPFEEGKTYYITLCALNVTQPKNWMWNTKPVKFTYSTKGEPAATADVSTIAFAVASVLGCGALVVRKKR